MSTTIQNAHAKLSPSSSDRWLACPASLVGVTDDDGSTNEYAEEGTAAHALAADCLTRMVAASEGELPEQYERFDNATFRSYVQVYLDYVMERVGPDDMLFVEQRLNIFPKYDVWGTADAVIITPDGTVKVIDLKFGSGILVEAEDNTQLLLYGIGGLVFGFFSKEEVHTVEVHICQPRRNNFPAQSYLVGELENWVDGNIEKVKRAAAGVDEAVPGNHCRWCPKKTTCRTRHDHMLKLARFTFDDEPECAGEIPVDEAELVKIFLALPMIRKYLEDVEKEVAKLAHDHNVPGLKWVPGRSARVFTDEAELVSRLLRLNINPYKERTVIGVTEIEKQLKAHGENIEVLKDLVKKVEGKPILVSESDKRKPVDRLVAAQEDFA